MNQTTRWTGVLACALVTMAGAGGCSGSVGETNGSSESASGSGGSSGAGAGGTGTGGAGTTGNGGDATSAAPGHRSTEMVSAGVTGESPKYRMILVLGQSTQNQGKSTSDTYRLRGGVVGASGSEK